MYNKTMNSKIINKILHYAKDNDLSDFTITKNDGSHFLWSENNNQKHQLKLPSRLASELESSYRSLLKIAPNNLVSGAYFKNNETAYHLAIIPNGNNEKIIINTVSKSKKLLSLSQLGLGRDEKKEITIFLKKQRGAIIVASDDNQGKTTTLYALLDKINRQEKICYSLEKYRELALDDINQFYEDDQKRLTTLSTVLKTDSQVIMIDDANDHLLEEGLTGAQSGRLVLLGVKEVGASALVEKIKEITKNKNFPVLMIYQKLINRNCPHCLKKYVIDESSEIIEKYWPIEKKYRPKFLYSSKGCNYCSYSGINGKIAVYNVIILNQKRINFLSLIASDLLQKAANGLVSARKIILKDKKE